MNGKNAITLLLIITVLLVSLRGRIKRPKLIISIFSSYKPRESLAHVSSALAFGYILDAFLYPYIRNYICK